MAAKSILSLVCLLTMALPGFSAFAQEPSSAPNAAKVPPNTFDDNGAHIELGVTPALFSGSGNGTSPLSAGVGGALGFRGHGVPDRILMSGGFTNKGEFFGELDLVMSAAGIPESGSFGYTMVGGGQWTPRSGSMGVLPLGVTYFRNGGYVTLATGLALRSDVQKPNDGSDWSGSGTALTAEVRAIVGKIVSKVLELNASVTAGTHLSSGADRHTTSEPAWAMPDLKIEQSNGGFYVTAKGEGFIRLGDDFFVSPKIIGEYIDYKSVVTDATIYNRATGNVSRSTQGTQVLGAGGVVTIGFVLPTGTRIH